MMAIERKQLNSGERVWLDRDGKPYVMPSKAVTAERQREIDAVLLDAAGMEVEGERRWFAFRTANRGEIEIRDSLVSMKIDAVVPQKTVPAPRRFSSRSRKVVHKPVLRNLVFVRVVPSDDALAGLRRVRGIVAAVGSDDRAYPIADKEMNGFMHLAERGAFDERVTPTGLKVGSRVKINVGPYADFTGIFEGYAKARSARVLTYLFGHDIVVDVKLAHLERLG
ncbi:transcription termination/antitermination protein NusG [Aliihoeflea sp. PC F10.4]